MPVDYHDHLRSVRQVPDMRYLVYRLQTSEKIHAHPVKVLFPEIPGSRIISRISSRIIQVVLWIADKGLDNS